jgi:hypothetical protein
MRAPGRPVGIGLVLAGALLAAGCGSSGPAATAGARRATTPALSLNTSTATPEGTWAAVVMGGSAAQYNNFWQLFVRPAGSTAWKLVTPPGTADNGGLVVASGGQSLITGFRPSQDLTYTPLIETGNTGRAWSALSPLDAALARTPDSLAVQPGTGRLLALTTNGTAELAGPGDATWRTLTSGRALAATRAAGRCGLDALTAAAFTSSGAPLLGGACARAGTAGIFADQDGTWQPAGPAIPPALARQHITVLGLTQTDGGIAALLDAGTSLLAAWSADGGSGWTLSPALPLGNRVPDSVSFGSGGTTAIILTGGRGETTAPGSPWRPLPALPPGTATLTPAPGGQTEALAVHSTKLTVWQLPPGASGWATAQVISVPIEFGSSS